MSSTNRRPKAPVWARATLIAVLILLYIPILVMVTGAFRVGEGWGLENFQSALTDPFWMEALARSALVAVGTGVIATLIGMGIALTLDRKQGFGWASSPLQGLVTLAMVMPELVFALTLLSWFAWLGQGLSLFTVLIAHVTFSVSFSYLIFRGRLAQMDLSLIEAAQDLGASPFQAFWKVKLPLLGPTILSSFLVCFILSFDDFLISYFVNGVGSDTLPIKLYSAMKTGISPQLNALATIMALISGGLLIAITRSNLRQK